METGEDLSAESKEYIKSLGLLDSGERIIMFDSQGGINGVKTSGNFFTDRRIASYWIAGRDTTKTIIDYAYYADIDTIWRYPKFRSLTLASYLEGHRRDGRRFKVYVSADSIGTWQFFNGALEEWSNRGIPAN